MKRTSSKIMAAAALLFLLAAGIYVILQNKNTTVSNGELAGTAGQAAEEGIAQPVAQLAVQEPFENVKPGTETLRIEDPSRPSIHTLSTGTVLRVPANAFSEAGGTLVTDPVQLTFREFHSAAEIIVSGIPMRVPKADGTEEWLQTAGMYEINGTSNGQPIDIASGKAIEVDLRSQTGGDYDFWIFDKASGSWVNQGAGGAPKPQRSCCGGAGRR